MRRLSPSFCGRVGNKQVSISKHRGPNDKEKTFANLGISQCAQPILLINLCTDVLPFFDGPRLCSASALNQGELNTDFTEVKKRVESGKLIWASRQPSLGKQKSRGLAHSISQSSQNKCQLRGRFLESLPLSWECQSSQGTIWPNIADNKLLYGFGSLSQVQNYLQENFIHNQVVSILLKRLCNIIKQYNYCSYDCRYAR